MTLSTTMKILLIEDNPGDARLIRLVLAENNPPSQFDVTSTDMLSKAVELLKLDNPDAILLDLSLPDSYGLGTVIKIVAKVPNVPIIILTGQDDEELAISALKEGAQDYLVKNQIDGNLLARTIRYAIERKQTDESMRQRLIELEMLYESSLVLNQLLSPKEIGQKIIELLKHKLDWHHTTIRLYHPQQQKLELLAFNIPDSKSQLEHSQSQERFKTLITQPGEGMAGWVILNGKTVCNGEVSKDARYVETEPGINSGLYVPLKVGERVIGVLSIESEKFNAFSEAHKHFVETLTAQAATALENARLFQETNQHVVELETLNRVSVALRAASKQEQILAIVLEEALGVLKTSHGMISLWNDTYDGLRMVVARGWLSHLTESTPEFDNGVFEKVFAGGEIYSLRDFVTNPLTGDSIRKQIPEGWGGICIPIRDEHKTIGVLLIAVPGEWELSKNETRLLNTLAEMTGSVLHRMRLYQQTEQRLQKIVALSVIDKAISSSRDIQFILNISLEQIANRLGVDAATVLLFNHEQRMLEYSAGRGFRSSDIANVFQVPFGQGQAGRCALEQHIILTPNVSESTDSFPYLDFLLREKFVVYYSVPLIAKGKLSGVLEIFHRKPLNPDPEWMDFLETLAGQAAIAIDNATLFNDLQHSNMDLALAYDATIEGWSHVLDLRDKETEGHSQRVTEMTILLARAMNISEAELVHIRRGALLHDIGKMGIPDAILLKPGSLTADEWEVMRKHPAYAYEMLSQIEYLTPALGIPYCHHEKWDGTGYPRGLKGEEIPLAARIFSVADVYDALTSDRPYRKAWPRDRATAYIQEQAGVYFDPAVIEVFNIVISD